MADHDSVSLLPSSIDKKGKKLLKMEKTFAPNFNLFWDMQFDMVNKLVKRFGCCRNLKHLA